MAELGGSSNFPFELGGEPSREMKSYTALKRLVGEGMSAPSDEYGDATLIESWRMAKAHGLAAITSFAEAAMWQAFPNTATDEVQSYEEILGIFPAVDEPIEARRQAITEQWAENIESALLKIEIKLAGFSSLFSVLAPDRNSTSYVKHGKAYGPVGVPSYSYAGGRAHTNYPNYSSNFVVNVLYDLGEGVVPNIDHNRDLDSAKKSLRRILPAWCDYNLICDVGFTLDISLLDLAGFSP